jgi:hypothetical protein
VTGGIPGTPQNAHAHWESVQEMLGAQVRAGVRTEDFAFDYLTQVGNQVLGGAFGPLTDMERYDVMGDLREMTPQVDDGRAEYDRLRLEQLDNTLSANRLAGQQFGALSGFAGLLGMRGLGSFAHGGRVVGHTQLAVLHPGETVTPSPTGPYGTGQSRPSQVNVSSPQVTVIVDRDGRASATVDGRPVDVISQRIGQRTRAQIAAANGRSR